MMGMQDAESTKRTFYGFFFGSFFIIICLHLLSALFLKLWMKKGEV